MGSKKYESTISFFERNPTEHVIISNAREVSIQKGKPAPEEAELPIQDSQLLIY
jgi:hypothetical protein